MTVVGELAEGLKLLTEIIENTRSLLKSINDGREYLRRTHPEALGQWGELIQEMQHTIEGLAEVTKVITDFTFVEGPAAATEPVRFNQYLIDQNAKVADLKGRVRTLKGNCRKVRDIRDALDARSAGGGWGAMFGMLGEQGRRDAERLASVVGNFYADDQRLIDSVNTMLRLAVRAMRDVQKELAPAGIASAVFIPKAAAVLAVYSRTFAESYDRLGELVDALDDAESALTGGSPNGSA